MLSNAKKTTLAQGQPRATNIATRAAGKTAVKPPSASVAGPQIAPRALTPIATTKFRPAEKKLITTSKSSTARKAAPTAVGKKVVSSTTAAGGRKPLSITKNVQLNVMTKLPVPTKKVPLKTSPKQPQSEILPNNNASSQEVGIQTNEWEIQDHAKISDFIKVLAPSPAVVTEIKLPRQADTQRSKNVSVYGKMHGHTVLAFHERVMEVHGSLLHVVDHGSNNQDMLTDGNIANMGDAGLGRRGTFRYI